jgi:hypothetical protein
MRRIGRTTILRRCCQSVFDLDRTQRYEPRQHSIEILAGKVAWQRLW